MKDPIALNRADTGETVAWCCGECGMYCGNQEDYARYHCGGRPCEICGKPSERYRTQCPECIQRREDSKQADRIARATRISATEYTDPVYWEEQDRYFADLDLAWDAICDDLYENPESVGQQTLWACDKSHLKLCADDILESALNWQEFYEDAREDVPGKAIEELRLFCSSWNDAYGSGVEGWFPNNQLIVIPESWTKDFVEEMAKEKQDK